VDAPGKEGYAQRLALSRHSRRRHAEGFYRPSGLGLLRISSRDGVGRGLGKARPTLFDECSWHTFYPVRVHPDFAGRIWAAMQERFDAATHHEDDWARDNLTKWYRLCHGAGAGISGTLSERANLSAPPAPPQRPTVIPALLLVMLLGKAAGAIAEKPEAKHHRGERNLAAEITTPAVDEPCTVMPPDITAAARDLLREHRDQRYGILADLLGQWCDHSTAR
jgi:hypothetical protein